MADEQWYCVYDEDSGDARSYGTEVADPLPEGLVAVELASAPDFETQRWDADKRELVSVDDPQQPDAPDESEAETPTEEPAEES